MLLSLLLDLTLALRDLQCTHVHYNIPNLANIQPVHTRVGDNTASYWESQQ